MNSDELRDLYGRAVGHRRTASRAGCISEDALLSVAAGDAPGRERLAVLEHVAQCPECRAEFDLLRTVTGSWPVDRKARLRKVAAYAGAFIASAGAVIIWLATCAAS